MLNENQRITLDYLKNELISNHIIAVLYEIEIMEHAPRDVADAYQALTERECMEILRKLISYYMRSNQFAHRR